MPLTCVHECAWVPQGHIVCLAGCLIGFGLHQSPLKWTQAVDGEPTIEDPRTGARIVKPGYEEAAADEQRAAQAPAREIEVASVSTSASASSADEGMKDVI